MSYWWFTDLDSNTVSHLIARNQSRRTKLMFSDFLKQIDFSRVLDEQGVDEYPMEAILDKQDALGKTVRELLRG